MKNTIYRRFLRNFINIPQGQKLLLKRRIRAQWAVLLPLLMTAVRAQTVVPNGTATTTTTTEQNQTFSVAEGSTVSVPGLPAFEFNLSGAELQNAGTVATTDITSTVRITGDDATVLNDGVISGDSRAIDLVDGENANVQNAAGASILGTGDQRNGTIYANSPANEFSVQNAGIIDAGAGNLGAAFSAELASDGTDFDFENSGQIIGRGNAGAGLATAGDGIRLERSRVDGVLEGSTTGEFTGTITNSGTISSEGANGTVGGFRSVNGTSFRGTLTNEEGGVISGTQNGVYFGNATPAGGGINDGVVNNAGTISSGSRALNIDGEGLTVNNSGQIIGTGDQRNGTVYADSTAQNFELNNEESGIIDAGAGNSGAGFAVELDENGNEFTIDNDGQIIGRGNAGAGLATAGDGIRLERSRVDGVLEGSTTGEFTGTIINSGTISSEGANGTVGGFRSVNGTSFRGTLTNEEGGVISGTQNGVYFGNATPAGGGINDGVVNNAGTISSGSRALNIDGEGLTVNNSGQIIGTGDQRNGTVYFDGTTTNATLNNLESGVIDAGDGNNGSGVSIQIDPGVRSHTVDNAGTIQARGTAQVPAGVRIFGNGTADVDISNSGTIGSEEAEGILVTDVEFTGSITNSGDISGSTAAIDTRSASGDIAITQAGGSLSGGVFTGSGDDSIDVTGDSTITGDIDLGSGDNSVSVRSGAQLTLQQTNRIAADLDVAGTLGLSTENPVDVTGDVRFATGSELDVDLAGPSAFGAPITLLTAGGALDANGLTINDDSLFTNLEILAANDELRAQAAIVDVAAQTQDQNAAALAEAIQATVLAGGSTGDFLNTLNALDQSVDVAAFEAAAAGVLPALNIGLTRELLENQSHIFDATDRRLSTATGQGAWFETFGRSASQDGGSLATDTGYDADSFGFIVGYDRQLSDTVTVGTAFSYADIDIDSAFGSTEIEAYSFNLYAAYVARSYFLKGSLAYTVADAESDRSSVGGRIESDSDLDQFAARIVAGTDRQYGKHTISPFVSLEYANTLQDSFDEIGGLNLSVSAADVANLQAGIGFTHRVALTTSARPVHFYSKVGYYYDLLSEERELDASFGGNSLSLQGEEATRSSFQLDLGFGIDLTESSRLSVGYAGEYSSDFDSHTGFLGFSTKF